jgi:demethylmenaquinone methyltransferase/2-methoxy-6-polyprenyl-1,4-benzoquinol methylase
MVAGMVSGDKEAYEYLASSIAQFYEPEKLLGMLQQAGFAETYSRRLTFGVVTVYVGVK